METIENKFKELDKLLSNESINSINNISIRKLSSEIKFTLGNILKEISQESCDNVRKKLILYDEKFKEIYSGYDFFKINNMMVIMFFFIQHAS